MRVGLSNIWLVYNVHFLVPFAIILKPQEKFIIEALK